MSRYRAPAAHQTLRISLCHPVGDDCWPDAVFPSWMRGLSLEGGLAPGAVCPRGLYRLVHENALRRRGQPTALDPVLLVRRGLDATPARDRFHCAVNSRFDDARAATVLAHRVKRLFLQPQRHHSAAAESNKGERREQTIDRLTAGSSDRPPFAPLLTTPRSLHTHLQPPRLRTQRQLVQLCPRLAP